MCYAHRHKPATHLPRLIARAVLDRLSSCMCRGSVLLMSLLFAGPALAERKHHTDESVSECTPQTSTVEESECDSDTPELGKAWLRDVNRILVTSVRDRDYEERIFEAGIVGDLRLYERQWARWKLNIYASSMIRLRMTRSRSSPVRTPSFEPKGTLQFVRVTKMSTSPLRSSVLIINFVPWGHHSNGQDGCSLEGYSRDEDSGNCRPGEDFNPQDPALNLHDGSFSTNYSRLGLYRSWLWNGSHREVTIGAEVEGHHSAFPWGNMSDELYERYGKLRFSASFGMLIPIRDSKLALRYWYQRIAGISKPPPTANQATRNTNILEGAWYLPAIPDLGVYGRYYHGRDYYNIHFEREISRLEFGLTFAWQGLRPDLTGPTQR